MVHMDDLNYLQELIQLQDTINFINRGPYITEVTSSGQVVIYDKDGQAVMAFGKNWIEK